MKFKITSGLLFLFTSVVFSQITIDESLSINEIIEDVLVDNPCADVSNFIASTGVNFSNNPNGIGVFNANGSDFVYESGIVISSGGVSGAPGPNDVDIVVNGGNNLWPGDSDLEEATNGSSTFNASFIQFDFVPTVNTISFNFLMASEEYNQNFECIFSDAFAFILTDQQTGDVQNLAVLPGTNIPIEVTNIRPAVMAQPDEDIAGCPPVNQEFFDKYNFNPFNDPLQAAIAYDGQTISLKAEANVILGNTYTIKLVVADNGDAAFDTAIFLEAGSFSLGAGLGDDLTVENGNALCNDAGEFEIGVEPDESGNTQYQWFQFNTNTDSFEEITGETGPTLIINSSNTYQIEVIFPNGCSLTEEIIVEYAPPVFANSPGTFVLCDTITNDGFTTIDFTNPDLISQILEDQDPEIFNVTFFANNADAQNDQNQLSTTNYINTSNPQQISARVTVGETNCFAVTDFMIEVIDAPLTTLPETFRLCVNSNNQVIPEVEGEPSPPTIMTGLNPAEYTFEWFLENELLTGETGPDLIVNQAGTYSVFITNTDTLCVNEYSTVVFSSSPPTNVSATLISDAFASNNIIEVTAEGSNSIVYSLDDGPFQESNIFENVAGGNHIITVKDSNGCGETVITIFVLFFQQIITPNGDGFNDTWNLIGLNEIDPQATILIFDRFGRIMKSIIPAGNGWDGTYNGRPLFTGDYWFRADYKENGTTKVFRGNISLIR